MQIAGSLSANASAWYHSEAARIFWTVLSGFSASMSSPWRCSGQKFHQVCIQSNIHQYLTDTLQNAFIPNSSMTIIFSVSGRGGALLDNRAHLGTGAGAGSSDEDPYSVAGSGSSGSSGNGNTRNRWEGAGWHVTSSHRLMTRDQVQLQRLSPPAAAPRQRHLQRPERPLEHRHRQPGQGPDREQEGEEEDRRRSLLLWIISKDS